jgi:hypothetical protein
MSTLHTTRSGAPRRWGATALTLAAALIAVAVTVLFLALVVGRQQHVATPRHAASTVAPGLRHDRTAAAHKVRAAASSPEHCTYVRAGHQCVMTP